MRYRFYHRLLRFERAMVFAFAALSIFVIALWAIVSRFPSTSAPLILHFRSGGGVDLLGNRGALWTIPAIGTAIFIANGFLAAIARRRDRTIAILAIVTTFFVLSFLLLALIALAIVNRL
jgi:hypothetical protein